MYHEKDLMTENRFWNFKLQFFLLIMEDCDLLWWFWIMLTMDMLVLHCLMTKVSYWLTVIVWLIKNCVKMTCCMWMSRFWEACISKGWVLPTCKSQTIWGWPHGCQNMIFYGKQNCEFRFLFRLSMLLIAWYLEIMYAWNRFEIYD